MKTFPMTHYEWVQKNVYAFDALIFDIQEHFGDTDISFQQFADYIERDGRFQSAARNYGIDNANLVGRQLFHAWRMKVCRDKIYYMSSEVCHLVANTRLTIDSEFVEAPFEQIYVYTAQNDIIISDPTGARPVRGIYINLRTEDNMKFLRFVATSGIEGIQEGLDVNYYATFKIPEHGYLEDIADRQVQDFLDKGMILNNHTDISKVRQLFVFCVNTLLYLGCKNVNFINFTPENLLDVMGRKKSGKKLAKLQRQADKTCQLPFIIVNPNKASNSTQHTIGSGSKLDHQVMVSGHWRGQWKGSEALGNKKREIIRIQSYLKGLDQEEKESRKFVVK